MENFIVSARKYRPATFASVVGSKALKMRTAIFIGSLVTFAGALILGGNVAVKLVSGLIPPTTFNNPQEYIIAMISVLKVRRQKYRIFFFIMCSPSFESSFACLIEL